MKKLLFIAFALLPLVNFAQKASIKSDKYTLNGQSQDCYAVFIPGVDADLVCKEWKRFMKDFDAKVSDKKEIVATEAKIKDLSPVNLLSVYANTEKKDGGVQLFVGIDLGGAFLSESKHKDLYKTFEKKLEEFSKNVRLKAIENRLEEENKKLSSLTRKQEQLIKEKEKQLSNIEKWKKDISEAESKIKENESDQSSTKNDIDSQQKVVDQWISKKKDVN